MTIRKTVKHAIIQQHNSRIVIESDFLIVMQVIDGVTHSPLVNGDIVKDIQKLFLYLDKILC